MLNERCKIAVLVSGGGTNLQAILDAEKKGIIRSGNIVLTASANPNVYALERARKAGVETYVFLTEDDLISVLTDKDIDLIVLAGFLRILSPDFTRRFPNRIINIHPALIPAFSGKGAYGLHVHEMALDRGVKVTGATVHFVDEIPDGGMIIDQKAVNVEEGDTPQSLQKRVMEQAEHIILPRAVETVSKMILKGKI